MIAFRVPKKDTIEAGQGFYMCVPLSAAGATDIILDGVRSGGWRVLVGEDAHRLDQYVHAHPADAYDHEKVAAALGGTGGLDSIRSVAERFDENAQ